MVVSTCTMLYQYHLSLHRRFSIHIFWLNKYAEKIISVNWLLFCAWFPIAPFFHINRHTGLSTYTGAHQLAERAKPCPRVQASDHFPKGKSWCWHLTQLFWWSTADPSSTVHTCAMFSIGRKIYFTHPNKDRNQVLLSIPRHSHDTQLCIFASFLSWDVFAIARWKFLFRICFQNLAFPYPFNDFKCKIFIIGFCYWILKNKVVRSRTGKALWII